MKAFATMIVVVFAMPLLALPPVPAVLPPVVHTDMEVMTNIVYLAEVAP